jgi:hypothetical protein
MDPHSITCMDGLGFAYSACPTNAPNLYISELYLAYELFFRANCWEVFNKTGADVSTTGWALLMFTADNDFDIIPLTSGRTIANNDVWVMVNDAAADQTTQEDQTFANNDAYRTVVLVKNYALPVVNRTDFEWPDLVQDDVTTDENQVRYGRPVGDTDCPSGAARFVAQSGLALKVTKHTLVPTENQPFSIGASAITTTRLSTTNTFNTVPMI